MSIREIVMAGEKLAKLETVFTLLDEIGYDIETDTDFEKDDISELMNIAERLAEIHEWNQNILRKEIQRHLKERK